MVYGIDNKFMFCTLRSAGGAVSPCCIAPVSG